MMLLRLGKTTVNMDNVVEARIYEPGEHINGYTGRPLNEGHRVVLYTTATAGTWVSESHVEPSPFEVWLDGAEAQAFVRWLDANSTNLIPKTEMDEEWEAYKAEGGEMSRQSFEAQVRMLRDLNRKLDAIDMDLEPERWNNVMDSVARIEERLLY